MKWFVRARHLIREKSGEFIQFLIIRWLQSFDKKLCCSHIHLNNLQKSDKKQIFNIVWKGPMFQLGKCDRHKFPFWSVLMPFLHDFSKFIKGRKKRSPFKVLLYMSLFTPFCTSLSCSFCSSMWRLLWCNGSHQKYICLMATAVTSQHYLPRCKRLGSLWIGPH